MSAYCKNCEELSDQIEALIAVRDEVISDNKHAAKCLMKDQRRIVELSTELASMECAKVSADKEIARMREKNKDLWRDNRKLSSDVNWSTGWKERALELERERDIARRALETK